MALKLLPPTDDSGLVGQHDGLNAIAGTEFGEHAADVSFGGRVTDVERGSDLAVAESSGERPEHFKFAFGEITELRTID